MDEENVTKGECLLWVEMIPQYLIDTKKIIDITPPAPLEGEIRLVIWKVQNAPNQDLGGSDLFVKALFEMDGQEQTTDTHFNAQRGNGNFNWRLIFPFKITQ